MIYCRLCAQNHGGKAMMTVVCAWCGVVLRAGLQQDKVSHGICQDCADVLMEEAENAG